MNNERFIIVILSLFSYVLASCSSPRQQANDREFISHVEMSDRVEYGHLYYNVIYREGKIYLRLINAFGPNVFADNNTLSISEYQIISAEGNRERSISGGGGFVIKGPEAYTKLAYDSHPDGSICGWQITDCGSVDFIIDELSDKIILEAEVQCFMGNPEIGYGYRWINIKHESVVGDITGIKPMKKLTSSVKDSLKAPSPP